MNLRMLQRQLPWIEEHIGYKLDCTNIQSIKVFRDIIRLPNFGKKKYNMIKAYIMGEFALLYPNKVPKETAAVSFDQVRKKFEIIRAQEKEIKQRKKAVIDKLQYQYE